MTQKELPVNIKETIFTVYRNMNFLRNQHRLTTKQMAMIIDIDEEKLIEAERCENIDCLYDIHIRNICRFFEVRPDDLFEKTLEEG